jgi:molybdopterin converting factor small subunit
MARILFFGKLAELAGTREIVLQSPISVSAIKQILGAPNAALALELSHPTTRAALNLEVLGHDDDPVVNSNDELAFMPPVSGG